MNNLTIKYFQQELYKLINNCGLPAGTAYFILKDATNELEKLFNECIQKEANSENMTTETHTIDLSQQNGEVNDIKEEKENENE